MATRVRELLMGRLGDLRYEPTDKRIRAAIGDRTVIDTTRALLVWEPKRVVPSYAVPEEDVDGDLRAGAEPAPPDADAVDAPMLGDRPVLDPRIPFDVHTSDGERLAIHVDGATAPAAAFRPRDDALAGYVIVDFGAFDAWFEEDERNVGHPRDPFHRIDIVHSSRHVQVRRGGDVLADSHAPCVLFEPPLPPRWYLPPGDVAPGRLRPSPTRTFCAYKGEASYWSLEDEDDIAWSYPAPLREAAEITDRIAFFDERVDVVVDGVALERPVTPWSPRGPS